MFHGNPGDEADADLSLFWFREQMKPTERPPSNKSSTAKQDDAATEREKKVEHSANANLETPPQGKEVTLRVPNPLKRTPTADAAIPRTDRPALNTDGSLTKVKALPMPEVNWLKDHDMLPKSVPEARIMSVGFDLCGQVDKPIDVEAAAAQLCSHLASQRAHCPTRPIVFIGHAYGSIITERALFMGASEEGESKSILRVPLESSSFCVPFLDLIGLPSISLAYTA
jgi:hypothetical protein